MAKGQFNIDVPVPEFVNTDQDAAELLRLCLRKIEVDPNDFIGWDTETHGKKIPIDSKPLDWMNDTVTFWSLSFALREGGEPKYRRWCLRQEHFHFFSPFLENPGFNIAGWNLKYDAHIAWNCRINIWNSRRPVDGLVLAQLHDENRHSHGLKTCAEDWVGLQMTPYKSLFDGIRDSSGKKAKEYETSLLDLVQQGHQDRVADYASYDAFAHLKTVEWLMERLKETPVGEGKSLLDYFFETEMYITELLWRMERRGIYLDRDYLRSKLPELNRRLSEIENDINRDSARPLNLDSPKQLAAYFFGTGPNQLGLKPVKMTATNQPSTDVEVMEALAEAGVPVAKKVLEARGLSKTKNTYVEALLHLADYFDDKRIHPNFNQLGARCLPVGELVLTNRGYLPVERVNKGDLVISHTGLPRVVTDVIQNGVKPICKVTLSNGLSLRTTENHAYLTDLGWVEAQNLQEGATVYAHSGPEEWASIVGWPDFSVSSWGRVFNNKVQRFVTQWPKGKWGHRKVALRNNGSQKRGSNFKDFSVHQLVARAFLEKPRKGQEIRHLNGIAWDNTVGNLCWGTSKENRQDAIKHGTMLKSDPSRLVVTDETVKIIRTTEFTRGSDYRLAKQLNISREHVRDIRTFKRRKPGPEIAGGRATFFATTVVEIAKLPEEMTYGLTVEEDHSHVTGGVVTHNTGRLSTTTPNCFDSQTEILTKTGWVGLQYLSKKDCVAQWHKENGVIDFVQPLRVVKEQYTGEMVSIQNQHIDLVLTPNHRCPLVKRSGRFEIVEANNYQSDRQQLHAGIYQGGTGLPLGDDMIRLLVATQADGSWSWSQLDFGFTKKRKIQRLQKLLKSVDADFDCSDQLKKAGYTVSRIRVRGLVVQRLKNLLGNHKVFGPWILKMTRHQLDVFCDELFFWDGYAAGETMYFSSAHINADWAQIALALSDRRSKMRVYLPPSQRPNYQLDTVKRNYSWTTNVEITHQPSEGRVYCLTVPSGFVVVRRNGKVCISGQSQNFPRPDTDEWGIRQAFIAPPGKKLLVGDYEQVEMRIMADFSGDEKMIGAIRSGKDLHSFTVALMEPGVSYEEVVAAKKAEEPTERQKKLKIMRQEKKAVGFGIIYGAGPPKISTAIEISEEEWQQKIHDMDEETFVRRVTRMMDKNPLLTEAQAVEQVGRHSVAGQKISDYFEAFPGVKAFMEATPQQARYRLKYRTLPNGQTTAADWSLEERIPGAKLTTTSGHFQSFGYVQTLSGRYRRLEDIDHKNYFYRSEADRQAVNSRIQGTAADIAKAAMLRIDGCPVLNRLGVLVLNQVHDEIVMEVPEGTAEEAKVIVKQYMEHPFGDDVEALCIPIPVDLRIISKWSDAK